MSIRINESALLIQLENTTKSWIELETAPESFFQNCPMFLLQYLQMHQDFSVVFRNWKSP